MKWRSAWPIFHGAVIFALYLEDYLMYEHILGLWVSLTSPDLWPQNKCRSLWPIFHGPVILLYILKTVWCMNILPRNYGSVWPDVWPKNKCRSLWPIFHGPLICLIFWRLFDVWTSYFGIMSPYDTTFDLKINVGHCDLYFKVQWFNLVFWRLFDIWTPYFWDYICSTLWHIFHGPVILPNILKTIQWLNLILRDY